MTTEKYEAFAIEDGDTIVYRGEFCFLIFVN